MASTDNISEATKRFQTHISNLKSQCGLTKREICNALNINNIDDATPPDIKECSPLKKATIADYLWACSFSKACL